MKGAFSMNDESDRSGQGFVRRPIPKYNEEKTPGEAGAGAGTGSGYQRQSGYVPRYNSGYSDRQRDESGHSSYSGAGRREGGRQGGSGGYSSGYSGGGGYKSGGYGGYNRNNSNYGSNDRLTKQNDTIIQILREIRDRLPAPPPGTPSSRSSDSYSSRHSSGYDYNSGGSGFGGSDDGEKDDIGQASGINGNSAGGGGEDDQDEFDPDN
jgi:hypothetical protein